MSLKSESEYDINKTVWKCVVIDLLYEIMYWYEIDIYIIIWNYMQIVWDELL